jgi:hypothetical protein
MVVVIRTFGIRQHLPSLSREHLSQLEEPGVLEAVLGPRESPLLIKHNSSHQQFSLNPSQLGDHPSKQIHLEVRWQVLKERAIAKSEDTISHGYLASTVANLDNLVELANPKRIPSFTASIPMEWALTLI